MGIDKTINEALRAFSCLMRGIGSGDRAQVLQKITEVRNNLDIIEKAYKEKESDESTAPV